MRILSSTSFASFVTFTSILCIDFTCAMVSSSVAELSHIQSNLNKLSINQPKEKQEVSLKGRNSPKINSDSSSGSSSSSPDPNILIDSSDSEGSSPNIPLSSDSQLSKPVDDSKIADISSKVIASSEQTNRSEISHKEPEKRITLTRVPTLTRSNPLTRVPALTRSNPLTRHMIQSSSASPAKHPRVPSTRREAVPTSSAYASHSPIKRQLPLTSPVSHPRLPASISQATASSGVTVTVPRSTYKPITEPYICLTNENTVMYIYGCSEEQVRAALKKRYLNIKKLTLLNCRFAKNTLPADVFLYFPNLEVLNVLHCGLQSLGRIPPLKNAILLSTSRDSGEEMFMSPSSRKLTILSRGTDLEHDLAEQNMCIHMDEYNAIGLLGEILTGLVCFEDREKYLNACLEYGLSREAILALCNYWKTESKDYDKFYDSLMIILEKYEPIYYLYFMQAIQKQFEEEKLYEKKEEEWDAYHQRVLEEQFFKNGAIDPAEDRRAHELHDLERQQWIIQKKRSALLKLQHIERMIGQQHVQRSVSRLAPAVFSSTGATSLSSSKPQTSAKTLENSRSSTSQNTRSGDMQSQE